MKTSAITCAIAAVALGFSSLAFAERDGDFPALDSPQVQQPDRGMRGRGAGDFNHPDARNDRRMDAHGPQFRRGGYMPPEYRSRQYVVNDWRSHRLSAPPRGYNWVQVGADYALIAVATGLITQLVLNH